MTASNISVTAGSGTRLATNSYTEGAVTVHDEKVILGEPYLPTYTATTVLATTATANSHIIQIMAGASLKVRIRRIEVYQTVMATTATLMDMRLVRLTTAGTGGGALGVVPLDTADSAAGATAMQLPTAKGTEGTILAVGVIYMMQTLAASSQLSEPGLVWDFDRPRSKPLIIAAGTANGIALKNITAVAGGSVNILIWLDESSF